MTLPVMLRVSDKAGAGWRRPFRSELVERRDRDREEENPFETISLYCSL